MFDSLSSIIGVPEGKHYLTKIDQIRMIFLLLLSFPLGYINYFIRNSTMRLLYGLATGAILQIFMYGWGCLHIVAATLITYLFMKFFGRTRSPFWILCITVAHISFLHISRMVNDFGGWKLDATTIYMMSICKFSAIAFSYQDGGKDDSQIKSHHHKLKKIVHLPSILETFSFIFYFPSAIVGPSFDFADFREFIHLKGCYANIPQSVAMLTALKELLISFSMMGLYVLLANPFDPFYCSTKEFAQYSFLYKFIYMNISMTVQRAKYYTGWKLSHSGIIFCGLAYNPVHKGKGQDDANHTSDGELEHRFDKGENAVISEIEICPNPKRKIQFWNRTVHLWLKYSLFLRILALGNWSTSSATLITFMVSAFWHGFYPVYYIFFFIFYIHEQASDMFDKLGLFEYIQKSNAVVKYGVSFYMIALCNYLGITFVNLTVTRWWDFSCTIYFVPLIAIFANYFIGIKLLKDKKRRERASAEKKDK